MIHWLNQTKHFLLSQYVSDGLRITLSIVLPALVLSRFDQLLAGVTVSLGAVFVSIPDTPGPVHHRRNSMLLTCLCTFVVSLLTGLLSANVYALGVEIALVSFLFSMLTVYGARAGAIGTAAMLSMILVLDRPVTPADVLPQSGLILAGGLWFTALSLLFSRLRPYRPAQQAMGECIREMAQFLRIKALFYKSTTDLDVDYRRLVAQQIQVSEKQDAVRELLFKNSFTVDEASPKGRALVLLFVDSVDLYEQIMAMYYDYASLRERFGQTGILDDMAGLIRKLANQLDRIGLAIRSNLSVGSQPDFTADLDRLKAKVDGIGGQDPAGSNLVLKKILVNMLTLVRRIRAMPAYASVASTDESARLPDLQYGRFVAHQTIEPKVYQDNLAFSSSVFRHALRVAIACLVGYTIGLMLPYGAHSYWILLTITVILKPGFSLTKERNMQRLIGTVGGGLVGVAILLMTGNTTILFAVLLLFMLISHSFQRVNYQVMVFFLTPYVLILFRFMGAGYLDIAEERVLDTLIGCVIAFLASYLLFPKWESEQVTKQMGDLLRANIDYLQKLADGLAEQAVPVIDYKLARKAVYVSSANVSSAFQRMIAEPKSKQRFRDEVQKFIVLNHVLSANIANITSALSDAPDVAYPAELLRPVRRSMAILTAYLQQIDPSHPKMESDALMPLPAVHPPTDLTETDRALLDQLEFIQKISFDVAQVTDTVLFPGTVSVT
ncbi:MAG: FUSC family protein [Bacteroidetes bacterium]|nr:FUSC family protein [Fibrella sp.]